MSKNGRIPEKKRRKDFVGALAGLRKPRIKFDPPTEAEIKKAFAENAVHREQFRQQLLGLAVGEGALGEVGQDLVDGGMSPAEAAIIVGWAQGVPKAVMARELGCNVKLVYKVLERHPEWVDMARGRMACYVLQRMQEVVDVQIDVALDKENRNVANAFKNLLETFAPRRGTEINLAFNGGQINKDRAIGNLMQKVEAAQKKPIAELEEEIKAIEAEFSKPEPPV